MLTCQLKGAQMEQPIEKIKKITWRNYLRTFQDYSYLCTAKDTTITAKTVSLIEKYLEDDTSEYAKTVRDTIIAQSEQKMDKIMGIALTEELWERFRKSCLKNKNARPARILNQITRRYVDDHEEEVTRWRKESE